MFEIDLPGPLLLRKEEKMSVNPGVKGTF
jgi:hypothetical protein